MIPGEVELAPGISTGPGRLPIVAGPCVIETAEQTLTAARAIAGIGQRLGTPLIFKASYDKANRSSLGSFRGPGQGIKHTFITRFHFAPDRDVVPCPDEHRLYFNIIKIRII